MSRASPGICTVTSPDPHTFRTTSSGPTSCCCDSALLLEQFGRSFQFHCVQSLALVHLRLFPIVRGVSYPSSDIIEGPFQHGHSPAGIVRRHFIDDCATLDLGAVIASYAFSTLGFATRSTHVRTSSYLRFVPD